MRTRFLNTDYFTSNSFSSPIGALDFLNFPIPYISPSRLPVDIDDHLRFGSVLDVSLDIDQLPIDSALSKFFSDVIPQAIDVESVYFEDLRFPISKDRDDEKESYIIDEDKEDGTKRTSGSKVLEVALPEKDNETAIDDRKLEVIQFEIPEPAEFSEKVSPYEIEKIWIVAEVPLIDNNLDMLKPGLAIWYPKEVQEAVYSVENVAMNYHVEQKSSNLEDDGSLPAQILFQCFKFPLLEVDETSLGILTGPSFEDELPSVFEKLEPRLWAQKDNLLISGKEILDSLEYDTLNVLLDHSSSKQCLESELASLDMFHKIDLISMVEAPLPKDSEFHQVMADDDCFLSVSPVIYDEFEIFDMDVSKSCELFFGIQSSTEPVPCDWMFREDVNFKSFNDLVICQELALNDDTFKSLPIPIFSDKENVRSAYAVVEKKLADLKLQPLSASDEIYLDWHILEGEKCSYNFFFYDQQILEEIDLHDLDFELLSYDEDKLVPDFIFSDDALSGPNMEGCEESLDIGFLGTNILDGFLVGVCSGKSNDNGTPKPGNVKQSSKKSAEKASLLFKSMSQFNDLDFFLNPQKATTGQIGEYAVNDFGGISPPNNSMSAGLSSDVQFQQRDVTLYRVKLSDTILALIDMYEKSYLAIVRSETELKSFTESDDFKLLSLSKQQLMEYLNEQRCHKATSLADDNRTTCVTLCSIKQMAWYTCFYGIHAARLYIDKLCRSHGCLRSRLGSLQSFVVAADGKVDEDISSSHPSLLVIQGILQSNTFQGNMKVLIVAAQAFWWSLKGLVMSMGLSCDELHNSPKDANQPDVSNNGWSANAKIDGLLISDCLMVSHESVSACFPFNKFGLILEYGGSNGSSRITTLSPKVAGLPRLHFLKVELDANSGPRALCEGLDVPQNVEMDEVFHSLLKPDEITGSGQATDTVQACCIPSSAHCSQLAVESEKIQSSRLSHPGTVIIANTQNFDKEMIVSRRSTYQKILAMEKEGVQVVERDSDLPVDIIISSATCLVWYDSRNVGKKATALDEASSCLPLCVENIATNVLTLLSFTFRACIMVFEGDANFICTVMESSDGLYAAAASLGLDLQLFCSYSSELTDEIIVSCIGNSFKFLYPKMPESETLAESFLTKFPSVNPLTAHAILSSKGMLLEFLECLPEQRILAARKYHVPDESINLFSTLCKSGEREDSKSIMTDCSSSVSSGLDSDKCNLNIDSERKRQKCIYSPNKFDTSLDDFLRLEPLNQVTDGMLNPPKVFKPSDSWKHNEIFDEYQKHSPSNVIFGEKQELDFDGMLKPSGVPMACNSQIFECSRILEDIDDASFSLKDSLLGQNHESEPARMNNFDWHKSRNQQEDFVGEVIDLTSSPLSGREFFLLPKSSSLSASDPKMEKSSTMTSKISRRLSFGKNSHPTFPTAAEINSGSEMLHSGKDPRQSLRGTNGHPDTEHNNDKLLSEHRKNLVNEVLARRFTEGVPFREEISHYRGTPLSNAVRSVNPQPGSPWTMEFLNRIREKSRLRQQSLPADTASRCQIPRSISKVTKRRSPSILEFFKYQGGSTPGKLPEQKKQKRSANPPSSSKNRKPSTSFLPTCTPIDKRARQTLSFAVNETGNQTKLVWNDGNTQGIRKKY